MCAGCERENPILADREAYPYNVSLRLRVHGYTRARGLRSQGVCLLRRQLAIVVHEDKGLLVYDEACEQKPEDEGSPPLGGSD